MRRTTALRWFLLAIFALALAAACGGDTSPRSGLYIALGDSLSEGVGASQSGTGLVALVRDSLGIGYELLNLGHSGDTSQQLLDHGHLDRAASEIEKRNGNSDTSDDVKLVTLEIGGNDLLRIYFSLVRTGTCPDVATSLSNAQCSGALGTALRDYKPNLAAILDRLRAADPALPIVLLTLYNPFSHLGATGELGNLSLEGRPGTPFPEGLNSIIRAQAQRSRAILADVYPRFQGETQDLISTDFIHPNDKGYRVMAGVVIEARNAALSAAK